MYTKVNKHREGALMTRIINCLYEQQYHTVWIDKKIDKAIEILGMSDLVISEQKIHYIEGVQVHKLDIKSTFRNQIKEIGIPFIKEENKNISIKKPSKIIISGTERISHFEILNDDKDLQSIAVTTYSSKIVELLESTRITFGNEISQVGFVKSPPIKFLLQPIILKKNASSIETIDAIVTVYEEGILIVDFDLVMHEVPFSHLQNFNDNVDDHYLNRKCIIPEMLNTHDAVNPNYYSKESITIERAIKKYLDHIADILFDFLDRSAFKSYINYSLIKYDGEPINLDSFSPELKSDLYWIVNMPKNYTEMPKSYYTNFIDEHYTITKQAALYVSTVGRSLIVTTKAKFMVEGYELNEESQKYTLKSYIDPVIRICLMKKMYYHKIWNQNDIFNDVDLNKKETAILHLKDRMNKITFSSYGTVRRCVEYFEKNMVDFLNFREMDDIIINFKNKKSLEMAEKNEKLSRRINYLILLITIVFSYEPIEIILNGLNNRGTIDLTGYLNEIWLLLCVTTLIYIVKDIIINKLKKIISYLSKYYYEVKEFILTRFIRKR